MSASIMSYQERPQKHNYDAAVADFTRDLSLSPVRLEDQFKVAPVRDIDEEVKVAKKRQPIAKLDAERLLSSKGIPELRRRVTKRLRFKGKGHEYADMAQLLNMYQMWLDDLYPRAKFRDGLSLVEKVGHTKRLQVMRKTWMQETRPTQTIEEEEAAESRQKEDDTRENQSSNIGHQADGEVHEDDDLDALMVDEGQRTATRPSGQSAEDMDDLDALMAEESAIASKELAGRKDYQDQDNHFADEEEAMAEMGDMW